MVADSARTHSSDALPQRLPPLENGDRLTRAEFDPGLGGQVRISDDDYLEGAPELIAEVAASSAAYDLGDKKKAYRRNGVREYIVWQMFENKLDWFVLENDDYQQLELDANGILRSRVFPGLWLAIEALLQGNMIAVLTVLQQGLNSAEHQAFVLSLN